MQEYIANTLVDGMVQYFDLSNGELKNLSPLNAHPMILKVGSTYVVCSELVDQSGKQVPLDVYIIAHGDEYSVIRSEINNRKPLSALYKNGKAEKLN